MARNYQDKDIKLLWGRAAALCAFPLCRRRLVLEQTTVDPVATIGEMAHIVAHAKGLRAPRVDPTLPDQLRDRYDNLILLCDTHHKIVDVQPNTYTVGELRGWKNELEQYVTNQLVIEITNVTLVELELVTKALMKSQVLAGETFQFDRTC